jgi:hypothetical protein
MNRKTQVALSGIAIRLALAPFTGQPYDMGLFAFNQRLFFQDGIIGLKTFPTLPLLYFIQLPFYAIYATMQIAGFTDYQFFYHTSLMIEGVFLKVPYILADFGIFTIIQKITRRLLPATLFFFNPLIIFESSVWGIYDSLMLFAIVYGLFLVGRGNTKMGNLAFVVGGVLKLYGFLPYAMIGLKNLITKRFNALGVQILSGALIIAVAISPVLLFGGFYVFLTGFVFRFVGLTGVTVGGGNYSILYLLFPKYLASIPSPTLLAIVLVSSLYIITTRKTPNLTALIKWNLVGAILLNIFSVAEPQWIAWTIPLSVLYASLTNRNGLQAFTYIYGTASTFLINTVGVQGTGYETLGLVSHFLPFVEGYQNALYVYGMMTFTLLVLMLVYIFHKPVKFRFEVIFLVVLVYLQAYFWFSIVNIPRIIGVA